MVIMETMRMMKTETPGNIIYRDDFAFRFADIGVNVKVFQPNPGQTFVNLQGTNDIQPVWVWAASSQLMSRFQAYSFSIKIPVEGRGLFPAQS